MTLQIAVSPFARWAALPNLAVLDTETTGFTGEVIEVALVDGEGKALFDERIRPHCRIEPGAMAVHKIQDGHLVGLPHLDHHWPRLRELLTSYTVVIFNKSFDIGRLRHSLNVSLPSWRGDAEQQRDFQHFMDTSECVMSAYRRVSRGGGNKLVDACLSEGVTIDDLPPAHDALGDALRTLRVIKAVAARQQEQSIRVKS
jgi:DNA polymerase-3 subunit epsilon